MSGTTDPESGFHRQVPVPLGSTWYHPHILVDFGLEEMGLYGTMIG